MLNTSRQDLWQWGLIFHLSADPPRITCCQQLLTPSDVYRVFSSFTTSLCVLFGKWKKREASSAASVSDRDKAARNWKLILSTSPYASSASSSPPWKWISPLQNPACCHDCS
ncbi:hypothetical protein AVEN_81425-1 [Araneus ventricosus]|uniref:Uncharacterized protein n=1 Tax=Araneus ventricosus TaxID=182803 RepID=A0A4Y2NZ59_ARAVE|nr:hypothetical protein AVEN_81425-1 [Araneus ventricosus]